MTARARGLMFKANGLMMHVSALFAGIPRPDVTQMLQDPVNTEIFLRQHGIRSEDVIAELTQLSIAMRMFEKAVAADDKVYSESLIDAAYDLLVDIEVAIDHLDNEYDMEDAYYIALVQHAVWFELNCARPDFDGCNPFKDFRYN